MVTGMRVGLTVVTSDGEELGQVKELAEHSFKIDVPHRTDYWLDFETVAGETIEGDRVAVNFKKSQVGEFLVSPRPTMTGNR